MMIHVNRRVRHDRGLGVPFGFLRRRPIDWLSWPMEFRNQDRPPGVLVARHALHRLRLACGNGLRADIWQRFQQRFAIPHLLEFYAATEGSVSLYNCEEKPGAIG